MAKLQLIYVPGLGDMKVTAQRRTVRTWQWWGVGSEVFLVNWTDDEPWAGKLQRLLDRIDELHAQGRAVALVGASAGAAAAINAFTARKAVITGVVCIAGKVNHP